MFDGITILNKIEVMVEPEWARWLFVTAVIIFVFGLMFGIASCNTSYEVIGLICFVASIVGLLTSVIISWIEPLEPTGRYQYEAIIEDNVPLSEVYERYEIIEQRGDIWVLEDKEE